MKISQKSARVEALENTGIYALTRAVIYVGDQIGALAEITEPALDAAVEAYRPSSSEDRRTTREALRDALIAARDC